MVAPTISPSLSPWLLWLWLRVPVLWLCLPSLPVLRLRLQAIRLLRLRLETRHQHRYRTWLGLGLLEQLYEAPALGVALALATQRSRHRRNDALTKARTDAATRRNYRQGG